MEKAKTKQLSITLRINDIKSLQFEITQRANEIKDQLPNDLFEFRFDLNSEISEQDKTFSVLLLITLFEKQSDSIKIELAKLRTLTTFNIQNFEEVVRKKEGTIQVPDQLISLTAGIAISTARGMLALKLLDTKLSNAYIPIINPQQLFLPKKENK